jgi:hypothetical protein
MKDRASSGIRIVGEKHSWYRHTTKIQNSKVNNVSNVIIILEANTKLSQGNTEPRQTRRQDQVTWRSKYPLLTSHCHRATLVEIKYTGLPVVKASMETTI